FNNHPVCDRFVVLQCRSEPQLGGGLDRFLIKSVRQFVDRDNLLRSTPRAYSDSQPFDSLKAMIACVLCVTGFGPVKWNRPPVYLCIPIRGWSVCRRQAINLHGFTQRNGFEEPQSIGRSRFLFWVARGKCNPIVVDDESPALYLFAW